MKKLELLLTEKFPHLKWEFAVSLAPFTYMKIGGPAEVLVTLESTKDIVEVIKFCKKNTIRVTLLGGASNVIISDSGVTGVVIRVSNQTFTKIETKDKYTFVRAGAGIKMAPLVAKTVEMGLTGLEFFLGVPGTLGGAIYNNAHYLQDLIGEHVSAVHVLTPTGKTEWIPKEKCEFAYEHSRFQHSHEIILEADFKLTKGDPTISQEKIKHATEYRASTQPLGVPSSGCIFQNLPNSDALKKTFPEFANKDFVPGGYIIDQAGLKGTRMGGIKVSEKHAAWFENDGSGTSKDVKALIQQVKDRVKAKFNVELQEEVFYIE